MTRHSPDTQDNIQAYRQLKKLRKKDFTASGLVISIYALGEKDEPYVQPFTIADVQLPIVLEQLEAALYERLLALEEMHKSLIGQIRNGLNG